MNFLFLIKLIPKLIKFSFLVFSLYLIFIFIVQPIKEVYDLNQVKESQIANSNLLKNEFEKLSRLVVLERQIELEIKVNKVNRLGQIIIGREDLVYLSKINLQAYIDLKEITIDRDPNTFNLYIKLPSIEWSQPQIDTQQSKILKQSFIGINPRFNKSDRNNKNRESNKNNKSDNLLNEAQKLAIEKAQKLSCNLELENQAIQESKNILKGIIDPIISNQTQYEIIFPINKCIN